ncbi:dihydropteroate synthase [uncultured Thiothrix sp.]|uniref:dihydropteroate synthase n=1 Tax=uncultured Thiothrix sp. TaxID=223185 RepID=UPI002638BA5E|nr:dihydropteroate synthase [uncultured Thiothrix sp.]
MLDLSTAGTQVMGILNITPDSFSDGGRFYSLDAALHQTEAMIQAGVDIIDIGGESTRPGAQDVSLDEELERVLPIIAAIRERFAVPISVDTSKPEVMRAALQYKVEIINDIRALQEAGSLEVCAQAEALICLMHMQGQPRTMQQAPHYEDVVREVGEFFHGRIEACIQAGIARERLILDPGFGFGKNLEHNLTLFRNLQSFAAFKLPLLVGVSRKAMIGALLNGRPASERMQGSVAAAVMAAVKGAKIVRVHDVAATVEALKIAQAVL